MADLRSHEMQALSEYRKAMDAVAEKDSIWRELGYAGNSDPAAMRDAYMALKHAWIVWIASYSRWVREHANARIDMASSVMNAVDNPVDN